MLFRSRSRRAILFRTWMARELFVISEQPESLHNARPGKVAIFSIAIALCVCMAQIQFAIEIGIEIEDKRNICALLFAFSLRQRQRR